MSTQQFCTFMVDGLYLGVDVRQVQEVLRFQEMTRVPLAPAVIAGLINLRGQIVTAIDLRTRLGLEERSVDALPMNVVVRTDESVISLLVDEIGDVIDIGCDIFEPTPRTLSGVIRDLVRGVCKLNGRLLLVLDIDKAGSTNGAGSRDSN